MDVMQQQMLQQQQQQQQLQQQLHNAQVASGNIRVPYPVPAPNIYPAQYSMMPPQQGQVHSVAQMPSAIPAGIQYTYAYPQVMSMPPGAAPQIRQMVPRFPMPAMVSTAPPHQMYVQQAQQPMTQLQQMPPQQQQQHIGLIRSGSTEVPPQSVPSGYGPNGSAGVRPSPAQSPLTEYRANMIYRAPPPPASAVVPTQIDPMSYRAPVPPSYTTDPNLIYANQAAAYSQHYGDGVGMVPLSQGYPPSGPTASYQPIPQTQQSQPQIIPQMMPRPPSHLSAASSGYQNHSPLWKPPTVDSNGYPQGQLPQEQQQQAVGAGASVNPDSRTSTMKKPRKNAIQIIDPKSNQQVMVGGSPPPSESSESVSVEEEVKSKKICNEFASMVAKVASSSSQAGRASSEQRVTSDVGEVDGGRVVRRGSASAEMGCGGSGGVEEGRSVEGVVMQTSSAVPQAEVRVEETGEKSEMIEEVINTAVQRQADLLPSTQPQESIQNTTTVESDSAVDEGVALDEGESSSLSEDISSTQGHTDITHTVPIAHQNGLPETCDTATDHDSTAVIRPAASAQPTAAISQPAAVITQPAAAVSQPAAAVSQPTDVALQPAAAEENQPGASTTIEEEDEEEEGRDLSSAFLPAYVSDSNAAATALDASKSLQAQAAGRKKYDREFLLQMKGKTECRVKPRDLPDMPEVVLNAPYLTDNRPARSPYPQHPMMTQSASLPSFHDMFAPSFMHSPSGMRPGGSPMMRPMPPPGMGGMPPYGPPYGMPYGMRNVGSKPDLNTRVISINKDVELNRSENAWKPASLNKKDEELDPDASKTQAIFKTVRSILNKITPQKQDILIQKVLNLDISTRERLDGIIQILFEKAISEPHFCPAYANLAEKMIQVKAPVDSSNPAGETTTFRKLLLNRCQQEFEKDKEDDEEIEKKRVAIEAETSEEKKKVLQEDLEETLYKSRRRSLGNIRFIGELFKRRMLTEHIMHDCIRKLLKNRDEDSLECLTRLLTNIGKDLDADPSVNPPQTPRKLGLEAYFGELKKFVNDKNNISARTRFMLQDVIELKMNKWVPRRVDNNPKTIEQIHQEAADEKLEKEQMIRNLPAAPVTPRSRPPQGRGAGVGEDGWQSVGQNKGREKVEKIDAGKMLRISKAGLQSADETTFTFGPPKSWGSGSKGGGATKTQDSDSSSGASTPSNRFAVLEGREGLGGGRYAGGASGGRGKNLASHLQDEQRSSSVGYGRSSPRLTAMSGSREGSRDSSSTRGDSMMKGAGGEYGRNTPPQSEALTVLMARSLPGSTPGSGDPSRDSSLSRGATPPLPPATTVLDFNICECEPLPSKTESSLQYLLKEYLSEKNVDEACLSMKELNLSSNMQSSAISASFNYTLERTLADRQLTGQLIDHWIKRRLVSEVHVLRGLQDLLSQMADLVVDIPLAWDYLSSMLEPLVSAGVVELRHLITACDNVQLNDLVPNASALLLTHTLSHCHKNRGKEVVERLWQSSGLSWSDIIASDVKQFLKDKGLQDSLDYLLVDS